MAAKTTAETAPYKTPGKTGSATEAAINAKAAAGASQRASYTPDAPIDPLSYGKDGGKAAAQGGSVPSVQVGGSFEVGVLPKLPGTLTVGDDKNVSTPVTG